MSTDEETGPMKIGSVAELLAHAQAIERDAAERYGLLADQMEAHNNAEVAALFRKLAHIEDQHAEHVVDMSKGVDVPHLAPWEYKWEGAESPETVDSGAVHYLMTPYHALQLALRHERLGAEFFAEVAELVEQSDVRALAAKLAKEEYEHVELLQQWLSRYPEPDEDWAEDPDPPMLQE